MLFDHDSALSGLLWFLDLSLDLVGQVVAAVHAILVQCHIWNWEVLLWHGCENVIVIFFVGFVELCH
jgi:hypothetical protein